MSLENDFKALFNNMKNDPQHYTDIQFYTTIADKIKAYVADLVFSASSVNGSDTGPAGTFTGSASGTLFISGSTIKAKLKEACDKGFYMTDTDLANAFGDGLQGDVVSFNVTISGQTVTSTTPPQTVTSSDSGDVTATFSSSRIKSKLITLFINMKNNPREYDDDDFAETLASEVVYYYTHPTTCLVQGSSHLSGSSGNGTIS